MSLRGQLGECKYGIQCYGVINRSETHTHAGNSTSMEDTQAVLAVSIGLCKYNMRTQHLPYAPSEYLARN